MCQKKDIDAILEQLRNCHDHAEKRRILERLDNCKSCPERSSGLAEGETSCSCASQHIEFLNLIEHIKQNRPFAR